MAKVYKSPIGLIPTKKARDDEYTQKMGDYFAKRKELLDQKDGYLSPAWNKLSNEITTFREGYEPAQKYSPREYLLDTNIDEFQIDKVRDDIDFNELWDKMQKGEDFYSTASVDGKGFDSEVREKIFNGIANRLGLDYDDVYDTWLYGKPRINRKTNGAYILDNGKQK